MASDNERLWIELDGPGAEPSSVDVPSFLSLAVGWVGLFKEVARALSVEVPLKGMELRNKCTMILIGAPKNDLVAKVLRHLDKVIAGEIDQLLDLPPINEARFRLGDAVRHLPPECSASFGYKDYIRTMSVSDFEYENEADDVEPETNNSFTSHANLRVSVVRVGGTSPKVRLKSKSEEKDFTLCTSKHVAESLAKHLYKDVDAQMLVCREKGVLRGTLISFSAVTNIEPVVAWRKWYTDNARPSDEVAALGEADDESVKR